MNNLKLSKLTSLIFIVAFFSINLHPSLSAPENPNSNKNSEIKLFPDWSNFTFTDFDPIGEGGEISEQYDRLVGWKVSRKWEAGDEIENILKLGDLENSLAPQLFSLKDIYLRVNQSQNLDADISLEKDSLPADLTLADFSLIKEQTIESLVEGVEKLGELSPEEIEPIADLLETNGYSDMNTDLETLASDQDIAQLELSELNLEEYAIDSIPGLSETQIEDLSGYEEANISDVPGLSKLPLSEYPNPVSAEISFVGRIDFIWGDAETDRTNTISGSKVEGFQVPCETNCANLELDDIENFGRKITSSFEGDQWIRGQDHWVAGGTGCLSGGREPTGIHPFGDTFKTVLWDTNESNDTAVVTTFFNIKTQCGDSAYFIGPFPYPQGIVRVNDWIYLGTGQ